MKKCFQLLGLLLALLFLSSKSFSQNNLAAGDLAIASYQSDFDPSNTFTVGIVEKEDRFSIVVLKPSGIAAGTVIYFTDRGWNAVSNNWLDEAYPPNTFGLGSEAVIKWVVPAGGIAQGTEVFFINYYHDELPAGSEYYEWRASSDEAGVTLLGTITNETPIIPTALPPPNGYTDGLNLAVGGDNLLVFQTGPPAGPATNYNDATRRFITALLANIVTNTTVYATWDLVPVTLNESSVPPGLVNGQTCFLMSPGPLPSAVTNGTIEPDNGKFSACALASACSASQMSAIIYNTANWTYNNSAFPLGTSSSQCSYNILSANTITLSSAAGTNAQTVCINSPITNITYNTTGATDATFSGLPAGVSGSWSANVVTISGSPSTTAGSPFSYTVTLTGGCGTITATGSITVTPNNTVTLTSAAGTNSQTVCINSSMTNITYSTTGATGASFSGLPTGVSGSWASNVVTITGTPSTTVGSPFSYTVTLNGGCGTITATGTITVNPLNTISLTSALGTNNQTVSVNTPITNITYSTVGATGASFSGLPAGVSGSWASNVVTISGSPSTIVGSPFNYTVTLNGGCGTVTAGGTITVIACSIILTSGAGTDAQLICNGSAINTITYSTNIATGANFAGLPAGVSGSWAANVVTISGTPSGPGTSNYTVTLTGGGCSNVASGSINVNSIPSALVISSTGSASLCTSGAVTLTATTQAVTDLSFTTSNIGTSGTNQWQSFKPNITGALNAIQIKPNGCPSGNITLNIYSGVGTGGTLLNTQTVTISDCSAFLGFNISALNLTAGNDYTFQLVTASNLSLIGTYSGYGSYFSDGYGLNPPWRLIFITTMTPALGSVQWFENNLLIPGATMSSYSPAAVGNYTAENYNGSCYSIPSNNIAVTNTPPVTPVITAGGPTTFCIPGTVTLTAEVTPVTDLSFTTVNTGTAGINQWQSFVPTVDGMTGTIEIQLNGTTNNTYAFNIYSGIGTFGSLVSTQSVLINGPGGFYSINITPVHLTPGNTYTFQLLGASSLSLTANNGSYGTYFSDVYGYPASRLNFKTIVTPFITNIQWHNGASPIGGANALTYNASVSGSYTAESGITGCSSTSNPIVVAANPDNTITLTSTAGTNAQTVCLNTPITNITYSTTGATGATFSGLPGGVSGSWVANVVTISGTPNTTTGSPFGYTVTLTGGCGVVIATGGITVNPIPDVVQPANQTVCNNTSTAAVNFTGSLPGTTFNWTNNTPSISLASSGSGNIGSFTATNATNAPVVATVIVTPSTEGSGLVNFNYTGSMQTWTVPAGVTQLTIETWGAQGGPGNYGGNDPGGLGGYAKGDLAVTPGQILNIYVGGTPTTTGGGWNGGGNAGGTFGFRGAGGGASDIRFGGTTLNNRILVGAGGGGSSGATAVAGGGGGLIGGDGGYPGSQGFGGTQIAGGLGSPGDPECLPGTFGLGGNNSGNFNCSGGGGGWYGGGAGAGGGGGSSYIGGVTGGSTTSGMQSGNGLVIISYIGTNCTGTPKTFTITVNPTPVGSASPQTICGGTASNVALSSTVTGTTYTWTATIQTAPSGGTITGFSNCAAACGTSIIQTLTNTGTTSGVVRYTVTPTANGCPGAPFTVDVTVDVCCPTIPTLTTNPTPEVCSGSNVILTASGLTTMNPNSYGITFKYFSAAPADPYTGGTDIATIPNGSLTGGGTGATTTTSILPVGNNFIYAILSPTPTDVNCRPSATASILVNPVPVVTTAATATICSGTATSIALMASTDPGTTFTWMIGTITGGITGASACASSCGTSIAQTLTNPGSAAGTVQYVVTPVSSLGCTGAPYNITVTVNPTPNAVATPASQTICSAASISTIVLSGNVSGTTYAWTRDNAASVTGIASSGSGNISGSLTNTTSAPVTVTFTITPTANSCPGAAITATVLVNPTPNAVATPASQTICSAASISTIVLSGAVSGTTYAWTRDNSGTVTGIASSGSGNISGSLTNTTNAPVTVTFTITPTANSCPGAAITATVLVNPTPNAVATPATQTICSAASISTIVLSGAVSGTTYAWTRDNAVAVTGIAASGSGNISGSLTNTTNAPVTVTFTIIPTANSCPGAAITATVLVNPTPNAVATPATQTICSATSISTIVLTGAVSGTTYAWTRNNTGTVTGIAASGSGNISGTLTNTTNAPVTVTFTIIPTANGCPGAAITATVLVNPTPTAVATPATQTICSETLITTITLSGPVIGTTFTWTRNNTATVTGIAASGSGNNIFGALTNTTSAPITVTFTITPSANGCIGTTTTATVIVNPKPIGTISIAPNPACVGSTVQLSASGGSTYSWSGPLGWTSSAQNPTILLTTHLQAGKYFVTVSNTYGCSVVLSSQLSVNYPPIATASYELSTACVGSNLQLHGTGAGSYAWSGPNGFTSNQQNPQIPNVTVANSGLYILVVTSPNGCTATTTLNITINNPPALSANPTLTQTCEGSKIQLFASGTGSFVWNGPATYTSTDQNPVIQNIPIHMSGIYTVNLTASTGCVSTASVTVKVYDQIHAIATASEDTICQGQSLQLHAEGGSTYLWNGPNGFNSTESDPRIDNITPAASGKYYVYISNEGGCFGYAELTIVVKPSAKSFAYATPNPVNENSPVQFIASSNGVAYSWSGPLGFTSNQQNPFIKKVTRYMAGVYTVTITNENGCPSIVKVILRVLYTNKGGNTIDGDGDGLTTRSEVTGTVYPNPTNDLLYFDTQSSEPIEYVIYDVNGKMQVVQKTTSDKYISTSQLPSGIYQIRWKSKDSEQWIVSKFVKIR